MHVFSDIIGFLKTLSFLDFVFFFAVLALMLLIITLIYFIHENEYDNSLVIDKKKKESDIVTDLKEIVASLEEAEAPETVISKYEEEQEEKAIISYDELVSKKNDFAINYSEEENIDDIVVKKVDLDNLVSKEIEDKPKIKVTVLSYDKEEAFLKALKTLQQHLN